MELVDPVAGVGDEELTDGTGKLAVEVDGLPPIRGVAVREILWGELRQVVPIRPDMIIDHVQDHPQPHCMRSIDKAAALIRCAVQSRRRKQVDTVISPAETAGEVRHWHDLDDSNAGICQLL